MKKFRILFYIILILFSLSSLYIKNSTAKSNKKKILVIPIKGTIELGLSQFIKRALKTEEYKESSAVIFDINTPGGRVDAAVEIKDMIFDINVPTIAYINKQAISAGALISISCKTILMKPDSTLGDVQPIPKTEKTVSYVSSQMRSAAEKNSRDTEIASGMVDADIEIDNIIKKGKLITFTTKQAIKHGYCDKSVNNLKEVIKFLEIDDYELIKLKENWAEKISRIVSNPFYGSMLFNLGFIAIIAEFFTPGFGVLGITGLALMLLFFSAKYIAGLAGIIEIILFVAGIVLLFIELFVTPGFGVVGFSGIILTATGFFLTFDEMPKNVPGMTFKFYFKNLFDKAFNATIITLTLMIIGYIIFIRYALNSGLLKNLLLSNEEEQGNEYLKEEKQDKIDLIGKIGKTLTSLDPSGVVLIDNQKYDVLSNDSFLSKGLDVIVIKYRNNNIIVKPFEKKELDSNSKEEQNNITE